MNEYDVRRLGKILALQAEIEGMKAENTQRQLEGFSLKYTESDFFHKAEILLDLSQYSNDQLISL